MSERDVVAAIFQLANVLNRRLAPVFEKAKISPQQWAVLSALADEGEPSTLVTIARRLQVTKQNMTGMVARLTDLGLLERSEDPKDLRSSRIQLTRKGRTIVEKVRPAYDAWIAELGMSERELQALTRSADRLIAQLAQAPE